MGVELREHHHRKNRALKRHAGTLEELYSRLCPVDAGVVGENSVCGTCGRQIREPKPVSDFVRPPDMSDEQAAAQEAFYARVERQRQEREQQEAAAAAKKKPKPEDEQAGRDWKRVLDSSGNIRYGG